MTIVATSFSVLQAGEQVQLAPNDVLRVTVVFTYTISESTIITLQACPYQYLTVGILDRIGSCCGSQEVELLAAFTPTDIEVTVDLVMLPKEEDGIADGTYGLIAEVLGQDAECKIDDCIIISGNEEGVLDMVSAIMPLMMMGMLMGMISGFTKEEGGVS